MKFQKGHISHNKGKKLAEMMPAEAIARFKQHWFKPGHTVTPRNYPVGTQMVKIDTSGFAYKFVKTGKGWKQLHRVNWEAINGPVPNGFILVCKSDDKLNCDPANWEMISRRDNMARNTITRFHKDDRPTVKLISKLKKMMHEKQGNRPAQHTD